MRRWSRAQTGVRGGCCGGPDKSVVASFHTYDTSGCNTSACWNDTVVPLTKTVPVVTGEFGEYDCATSYSKSYMAFADKHDISYLGWAWDAISPGGWKCTTPSLIDNYGGTPSGEGAALHSHLLYLFNHDLLPPVP